MRTLATCSEALRSKVVVVSVSTPAQSKAMARTASTRSFVLCAERGAVGRETERDADHARALGAEDRADGMWGD